MDLKLIGIMITANNTVTCS